MSVNPNKKPSQISYKTIVNTVIFVSVVLIVFFLFSRACEAIKNRRPDENDVDGTGTDSDVAADTNGSGFDEDGMIYIPITPNDPASGNTPPPTTLTDEKLEAALLTVTQDMGTKYLDKFYFLTDSSLYGLKYHAMLPEGQETDRVITGMSSSLSILFEEDALVYSPKNDSILTVADAIASIRPEYLLVSVGSDDVKNHDDMSHAAFKSAYSSLIGAIVEASPDTIVICMPILPGSSGDGLNIYTVDEYNKYIHESAAERGAYFIDISSAFASSAGHLRIDCDAGKSNLNTTGLKRVLDLIRSYKVPDPEADTEE